MPIPRRSLAIAVRTGLVRRAGMALPAGPARGAIMPCAAGLVFLAGILVALSAAAAAVAKCVDTTGAVTYSDLGCTGSQAPVPATLPPLGVVPPLAQPPAEPAARPARAGVTQGAFGREPRRVVARERVRATAPGKADASQRRFVSIGMSDAEVLARVGKPDRVARTAVDTRVGRSRTVAARERWIYLPTSGDSDTITVVEVESGVVASVDRKLVR